MFCDYNKSYNKINKAEELLVFVKAKKPLEFKLPIIEKEFALSLDIDTQNEAVTCLQRVK